jgi:hypothetical protein
MLNLGVGHASSGETLSGRVLAALRAEGLLSESVGAGYLDRHWPPALMASGAWPLVSLRQAFLDGSLTRLVDPEAVLRARIPEFVARGEFGLGSGRQADGTYRRVWYAEPVAAEEVVFESDVYLLRKETAQALKAAPVAQVIPTAVVDPPVAAPPGVGTEPSGEVGAPVGPAAGPGQVGARVPVRVAGTIPPEVWNRLGTRLIPKLRGAEGLTVRVEFACEVEAGAKENLTRELQTVLNELGLDGVSLE